MKKRGDKVVAAAVAAPPLTYEQLRFIEFLLVFYIKFGKVVNLGLEIFQNFDDFEESRAVSSDAEARVLLDWVRQRGLPGSKGLV